MGDLSRVQTSQPVQLVDANDLQVADISTSVPLGTEAGLIVRSIPSGTQTVGGTITASPTGTYTVAGSVTAVPSGTQTVTGTITAVASGTTTIVGSGTAGTASSGVVTVQGISNGIALTVDLTDASRRSKGLNTFTTIAPTGVATSVIGANANRASLLIYNAGASTIYLGQSASVTTGTGIPLLPNASLEDTESKDSWYAITSGSTGDLRIVETAI